MNSCRVKAVLGTSLVDMNESGPSLYHSSVYTIIQLQTNVKEDSGLSNIQNLHGCSLFSTCFTANMPDKQSSFFVIDENSD